MNRGNGVFVEIFESAIGEPIVVDAGAKSIEVTNMGVGGKGGSSLSNYKKYIISFDNGQQSETILPNEPKIKYDAGDSYFIHGFYIIPSSDSVVKVKVIRANE